MDLPIPVIISFNLQGEAAAGPEAAGRHLLGGHEPRGHLHPRRQVAHLRLDRQGLQPHGEAAGLQGMSRNLVLRFKRNLCLESFAL